MQVQLGEHYDAHLPRVWGGSPITCRRLAHRESCCPTVLNASGGNTSNVPGPQMSRRQSLKPVGGPRAISTASYLLQQLG